MNIKRFIDRFESIQHLPRESQFTVLEKAYQQTARWKFSAVAALSPVLCVCLLALCGYYLFDGSVVAIGVGVVLGLLLSRVVVSECESFWIASALKTEFAHKKSAE
ncbi:hypothetical protein [Alteromonas oceanisediminis]|uniref:hypothetical protein n=1 Tax=Alteromonas oceanisediminis TaxID=2836180 RepID=UPI001BDA8C99|nr:hypothetical protein [Alteromonas oceanisediminis]MBT0587709.1 hypothetical protein [Alteromonas oceanisediminis]